MPQHLDHWKIVVQANLQFWTDITFEKPFRANSEIGDCEENVYLKAFAAWPLWKSSYRCNVGDVRDWYDYVEREEGVAKPTIVPPTAAEKYCHADVEYQEDEAHNGLD